MPVEEMNAMAAEKVKIEMEEKRYLKAFGAELISFEAFEGLMKELKSKKALIDTQVANVKRVVDKVVYRKPQREEIEQFCDITRKEMLKADFGSKRAILTKFVDKIVADQEYMSVSGYIPFPLRKEAQNVGFEFECRNRQFTLPTFKFELRYKLPDPRKSRIIAKRDEFGRIVTSRPPDMAVFI